MRVNVGTAQEILRFFSFLNLFFSVSKGKADKKTEKHNKNDKTSPLWFQGSGCRVPKHETLPKDL